MFFNTYPGQLSNREHFYSYLLAYSIDEKGRRRRKSKDNIGNNDPITTTFGATSKNIQVRMKMGLKDVKTTHSTTVFNLIIIIINKKATFLFRQPTNPSAIALKTSHTLTHVAAEIAAGLCKTNRKEKTKTKTLDPIILQ
jgi:hypothetical protein